MATDAGFDGIIDYVHKELSDTKKKDPSSLRATVAEMVSEVSAEISAETAAETAAEAAAESAAESAAEFSAEANTPFRFGR